MDGSNPHFSIEDDTLNRSFHRQTKTLLTMPRQQRDRRQGGDRNYNNSTLIGSRVSVIQKHHQSTGERTTGIVSEILTNKAFHPRGLKVRLEDGTVGRIVVEGQQDQAAHDDCEYAGAPRQGRSLADFITTPPVAATDEPPTQWACSTCTFVNSGLLFECEMCQTARP